MANAFEVKERGMAETPLLLFDCELINGAVEHWSTHRVDCEGTVYEARVLRHNVFEMQTASDQGVDGIPRVSLTLANADSHFSQLERTAGWKGAKVTARFVFFDLKNGEPASESVVVFQGVANPPEEITEAAFRLSAVNRMSMQRVLLPPVRIQRRCPWEFPVTAAQREEAMYGGARGRYSRFFRCGYSAGCEGGEGNPDGAAPFTWCGYTRAHCEQRGMFGADAASQSTRRFGGIEFLPSSIEVRSYGEKGSHASGPLSNEARYNDFVPLVYGTAWYAPPVVFARNDGNLTHMEILLGMGEIQGVLKVVVNDVEIPQGQSGANMTATGWYNVASAGNRTGNFNADFPSGDPYGSMAYASVVVPNRISDGRALPRVQMLIEGLKLPVYAADGAYLGDEFTNNPAWVLLDVLQRSGWRPEEIDLGSFAAAAAYCGEAIETVDLYGTPVSVARFQCNLAVQKRRSAADLIRGVRNAARMLLTYGAGAQLQVRVENTLALEQPVKPAWSNSTEPLDGGWPGYEFGDGSGGTGGIARRENGEPSVRMWSRSTADTPNRCAVEFQDAFNEYQQDSFSLVDVEDVARAGQEITAPLAALGIANYDQAARVLKFHLDKAIQGNTYVEFETSVKGLGLRPGDLIALTYLKEGFERQPFRVLKIAPGTNYRTVGVVAQIHRDAWYSDANGEGGAGGRRQAGTGVGVPRPLLGNVLDEEGRVQYEIVESTVERSDGGTGVEVTVGFLAPPSPQEGAPGIPLVSLAATIGDGGTLAAGQTLYYAVSAVDGEGRESALSFTVRAGLPAGANDRQVTLTGLSFAPETAAFHVYRGTNPSQMYRIASDQTPAAGFTDPGLAPEAVAPPDFNYDHANFYWRLELQPESAATLHGPAAVGNEALEMEEDQYRGAVARITEGKGAGQERAVIANTATMLALASNWSVEPDATSSFVVAEAGWRFGAMAKTSPVRFEIPNRTDAVLQISGRAANVNDGEAPHELCTLTRWTVGGGGHGDSDVPPVPAFALGLSTRRGGTLELSAVSFEDLTNTRTIAAGTLSLYYWNELAGVAPRTLAAAVSAEDSLLDLSAAAGAEAGAYVQVEREVVQVEEVTEAGTRYRVTRGAHGSIAAAHAAGTPVYPLERKVAVVPFARDFFGSPASGRWVHQMDLPCVRVASAEFFVTNGKGNSPVAEGALTQNLDSGLRTLSGGQISMQVEGYLAIDSAATPDVVTDTDRSVRDIFAVVKEAPQGGDIELRILRNGIAYCDLTIEDGNMMSEVVGGFGLPYLAANDLVGLEVRGVGQTLPGSDLTVVVRL